MEKRTKESSKRINSLILLIAFTAIMLIVSTYAWFTSQKDITLSNLRGTVEVAENMEISLDAKTWHQEIDLAELVEVGGVQKNVFQIAQESRDAAKKADGSDLGIDTTQYVIPKELLPVSGIGETGSTLMPLYDGTATGTKLAGIAKCTENHTGTQADEGYFAFDIYIKNTSKDGQPDNLQLNLNSAVQVLPITLEKEVVDAFGNTVTRQYQGDPASGLQNSVRVGLALYGGEVSSTATQAQIIESTYNANVTDVAIWEPNAKDHVEYIVSNNNKLVNGTQSHVTFTDGTEVDTYALSAAAVGTSLDNVYNVSATGVAKQNTFRTEKTSTTDYRIKPRVDAVLGNIPWNITNVSGSNFVITSNTVSRLRVYVWLEGQDVDCINLASQGGGIEVDLGLTKDNEVGEVLNNVATP